MFNRMLKNARGGWDDPRARATRGLRRPSLDARSWDHPTHPLVVRDSSLRPCPGQGAPQGEEAVLADSGREGEISAGVGRVRRLDFLNILRGCVLLSQTCGALDSMRAGAVLPQPASLRGVHV